MLLTNIAGEDVPVPDPERLVHLQFRRFAGCPVCNIHLQSIARRHDDIRAAGIREVVVFHSPAEELREHAGGLPFDVIPDPDKVLYRRFGIESAPRSLLSPRAWPTIFRAIVRTVPATLRKELPMPPAKPAGGRLGLPGDFLIAPDGRTVASKRGRHAGDQWSVDELLALVPANV